MYSQPNTRYGFRLNRIIFHEKRTGHRWWKFTGDRHAATDVTAQLGFHCPAGRLFVWIEILFKHTTDYSNVVFSLLDTFLIFFLKSSHITEPRTLWFPILPFGIAGILQYGSAKRNAESSERY